MTDRELLEGAARAAGYADLTEWSDKITDHDSPHYGMPALHPSGFGQHAASWNPLIDDGDAFRLMVALGITVGPESADVIGKSLCRVSWLNRTRSLGEYGDGDPLVATRRAIVGAAAEMGGNQ